MPVKPTALASARPYCSADRQSLPYQATLSHLVIYTHVVAGDDEVVARDVLRVAAAWVRNQGPDAAPRRQDVGPTHLEYCVGGQGTVSGDVL
jgi:hypothetical protein